MFILKGEIHPPFAMFAGVNVLCNFFSFCLARSFFSILRMARSSILANAFSNVLFSIVVALLFASISEFRSMVFVSSPTLFCSFFNGLFKGACSPFSIGRPIRINAFRALPPGVTVSPASCARKRRLLSSPTEDCLLRNSSLERRNADDLLRCNS